MLILLTILTFVGIPALVFYYHNAKYKRDYPLTLEMYLAQHPECKTDNGYKCSGCGSKSLRNMGYGDAEAKRRMISCNHCAKRLYRVEN